MPKLFHTTSDNNAERFYEHVWPLRATVLRTAMFLCRNQTEAEDLAQETLMKAFRAIDQYHGDRPVQSWVMTILRNTRIDGHRKMGKEKNNVSVEAAEIDVPERNGWEPGDVGPEWENPEDILGQFSDSHVVAALQELPDEIRWTLLLVDVQEMDHAEVAAILDVPVGTIKSRTHRGRAMLRDKLAEIAKRMRLV